MPKRSHCSPMRLLGEDPGLGKRAGGVTEISEMKRGEIEKKSKIGLRSQIWAMEY